MNLSNLLAHCAILFLINPGTGIALPSAEELEEKVIANRLSLRSGHLVFSVRYNKFANDQIYEKIGIKYNMYFDGKMVRSDVSYSHPNWAKKTKTVFGGDFYINDAPQNSSVQTGQIDVDVSNPPESARYIMSQIQEAFDPRLLGLVPGLVEILRTRTLQKAFLYTEEGGQPSVASDVVEGKELLRIDHNLGPSRLISIWIAPQYNFDVEQIRVNINYPLKKYKALASVKTTFREYDFGDKGRQWFPSDVVYRLVENEELKMEQTVHVEQAEFNILLRQICFISRDSGSARADEYS